MLLNAKNVWKELQKKKTIKKTKSKVFSLEKFLFPEQLAFVRDPAPFKTAVCSRRAGKTISCAADLVDTALRFADTVCLYITLSRKNAKRILWKELKKINRDYNLNAKFDNSELSLTLANESVIYLTGAKDASEIEKFRGLPIKKCYIDECQSFRQYIKDLIDEVVAPALMDYAGSLCLIGTPGPVPAGYFHDCSVINQNWSHHHWTFWNNPFILKKSKQTHQALLERELKRRGISADHPSIQREWFGKWVLDSDSLLLHYSPTLNHFVDLLPRKYTYILGIDLGFNDADALAVIAWSDDDPVTYLLEERIENKQGLTELVGQIHELEAKYDFSKIVIDEGGLGKKLAEELRRRHHIPVQPADKTRKMENVAFLDDALRTARFKARKESRFAQDSYLVEKDRDKSTPDRIIVSNKYHSDIIDATLYAFKESPAFAYIPPIPEAKPGTPEWMQRQVNEMEEQAMEYFQNQKDVGNRR